MDVNSVLEWLHLVDVGNDADNRRCVLPLSSGSKHVVKYMSLSACMGSCHETFTGS